MFQRVFPFLFFLPSPCPAAMRPQSRCEKLFSFTRHLSRLHCSALHRRSLPSCDTADISARQSSQTPLLFRIEVAPAFSLSVSVSETSRLCAWPLSLPMDKQTVQRLSAALARIPAFSLPCRCYVLGWLLAAVILHTTIHRTFNHTRTICSILITASKMPLHQSAGAFSLLSGLEQVLQQRIFEEKPHQNKAVTHNYDFARIGGFPRSSDSILLGKLPEQRNLFRFQAQGDL